MKMRVFHGPRLIALMAGMLLLGMFHVGPVSAKNRCEKEGRDLGVDVGVVLDANSKAGKEMIAATEGACRCILSKHKLELRPHYANSDGDPQQALSLAEELIGREEVQVIVWLDEGKEEGMLDEMSRRLHIPILSFGTRGGSRLLVRKHDKEFEAFRREFVKRIRGSYGDSDVESPSMDALRAYDCMTAVTRSFDRATCRISKRKISKVKYTGLSGPIDIGKDAGLRLWQQGETRVRERGGDSRRASRILKEPAKKKILVPGKTPFGLFVKEEEDPMTRKKDYTGFCIDVFKAAWRLPTIPDFSFEFETYSGTYDDLVDTVADNQTYIGAVGDITILSHRSEKVEFTQPFMESSLSMIVLATPRNGTNFLFLKPFTPTMWAATGGVLLYTTFIVWALESGHDKEFSGPWTHQLSAALWFTFSSLFFAQREQVHYSLSRIVVAVWFFIVLILTQSYTASLTSMLTLQNIKPSVTTIASLRENRDIVGCNPDTFVCNYLVDVLNFTRYQILNLTDTSIYGAHIQNKSIAALFLEDPYEKAFFTDHCQGYVSIPLSYRFGGFGFVFKKNSPLTKPFSEAILELLESGNLTRLQGNQFASGCATLVNDNKKESLPLSSFYGLFFFTVGISTCCLIFSHFFPRKKEVQVHNESSADGDDSSSAN